MPDPDPDPDRAVRTVIVIGGGIAGLTAAYRLSSSPLAQSGKIQVLLLEAGARLGGTINTYPLDDVLLELGPDSFITDKPYGLELCRDLGIEDRLLGTDKANRRTFVARQGKLFPLPDGFVMMAPTELGPLMESELFSWPGKLRMLQDLFIAKSAPDQDESLTQFVTRRLGKEALERVVQPLVGGIYTGDPDKLSVKAALPRIAAMEQKHGSLIKGMLSTRQKSDRQTESGARYGLFTTFDQGMSVLVRALQDKLPGDHVHTNSIVSRVIRHAGDSRWSVYISDDRIIKADALVMAAPSHRCADMLAAEDPTLSGDLRKIEYSSSVVINLLYRRSDVHNPLKGFGFVVPRSERRTILACSYSSIKWPGRTPPDKLLLRVFVGGTLQPEDFFLSDEQIECLVWEDLRTYLGIKALPQVSISSRFPRAMPQYNIGHTKLIEGIEERVGKMDGLELAGNAYHGVGIPDCIASGNQAAARLLAYMQNPSYI
jgi:protoporphyrinogen/coproporphyrinogen III oxidase